MGSSSHCPHAVSISLEEPDREWHDPFIVPQLVRDEAHTESLTLSPVLLSHLNTSAHTHTTDFQARSAMWWKQSHLGVRRRVTLGKSASRSKRIQKVIQARDYETIRITWKLQLYRLALGSDLCLGRVEGTWRSKKSPEMSTLTW